MPFAVVSDERRRKSLRGAHLRGLKPGSAVHRLLSGQTLLISYTPSGVGHSLAKYGYKLRQRQEPDGYVCWAEPIKGKAIKGDALNAILGYPALG